MKFVDFTKSINYFQIYTFSNSQISINCKFLVKIINYQAIIGNQTLIYFSLITLIF